MDVGSRVGAFVILELGLNVGSRVGAFVRLEVGLDVGSQVGVLVVGKFDLAGF